MLVAVAAALVDAADGSGSLPVSTGVLGLARHLAHHQNLLQGFLHVLVHLTLRTHSRQAVSQSAKEHGEDLKGQSTSFYTFLGLFVGLSRIY